MSNKSGDPAAVAAAQHAAPVDAHPPLLPPFESTGESLVDSLQQYSPAPSTVRPALRQGRRGSSGSNLSRISVISSIRKSKDKSDTASLLTVDEITAEVENRRASMSTLNDSQEHERPFTPAASDVFPSEDDATDSSPSDTESEESTTSTDSEDHEQGKAYMSRGCECIVVWSHY
jgi:mitogen-activated protein kinase kinase kinase